MLKGVLSPYASKTALPSMAVFDAHGEITPFVGVPLPAAHLVTLILVTNQWALVHDPSPPDCLHQLMLHSPA